MSNTQPTPEHPQDKPARKRSRKDWTDDFLLALQDTANIKAACQAAKVGRSTVYRRRDSDEIFATAMAGALDEAIDDLELEARRRAKDGVTREEGVFYKGQQVATKSITEYSDVLLMFLLKAHRPEKYRDRVEVKNTAQPVIKVYSGIDLDRV
jgi:hypothetical protein